MFLSGRLPWPPVLALPHVASGKVREIFSLGSEHLLMVATDRISAYDVVLTPLIPDKGRVLTGLSLFFFDMLDVPNHLVGTDLSTVPELTENERVDLAGRSMIVRRAEVLPMECVVRGYLSGSCWREYMSGGGPSTEHLPPGLEMAAELDVPIFTPATKATSGHDVNLTEAQARELVGNDIYEAVRKMSVGIYENARNHAASRGVILADTKLEFGFIDDTLTLVDEVLTPDSSRYWPVSAWRSGGEIPSFDKQFVRNWLDSTGWDHTPPAPSLPGDVVTETRVRYVEAYESITGARFDDYLRQCSNAPNADPRETRR